MDPDRKRWPGGRLGPGGNGSEPDCSGKLRALVTNDDGLQSRGLWALADAARSAELDVMVVAPSWDSSGASASLTAVSEHGRVIVDRHRQRGSQKVRALGVHGPPAFIVRAAVYGAFGPPPDIVLSGINRGPNTGQSVLHSGTVGAALTAANHGRTGLAISMAYDEEIGWEAAAWLARQAVEWTLNAPNSTVLNVNIPARDQAHLRGLKVTRLAPAGVVQSNVTELDSGFVPVTFVDEEASEAEPGTDTAALSEGYVSVTAIKPVCVDSSVDVAPLFEFAGS